MNKYFKIYIIYIVWCIFLIFPYLIETYDCKKSNIEKFEEDNLLLSSMLKALGPLENPSKIILGI